MDSSTFKFVYTIKDHICTEEYPSEVVISVELGEDATINHLVNAFKMFLKGCEFSEECIERIYYNED